MNKEAELQTITRWLASPSSQESENLASKSHETRRIPDPYIFISSNGKLITPEGVEIEKAVSRGTDIYEKEYEALLKIQDWVTNSEEGISLWFSPPYHGGYSSVKIVAGEILYALTGEKVLFNRAIVLDVDANTGLKIANLIGNENFIDPEDLRKNPIFLNSECDWLDTLSSFTNQTDQIISSEDLTIKERTIAQINSVYLSNEIRGLTIFEARNFAETRAREMGLIGEKQDSCSTNGGGAFNTLFNSASTEFLGNSFSCPRCHGPIPSGLGITTCPHCGLTKEEAGSTCG